MSQIDRDDLFLRELQSLDEFLERASRDQDEYPLMKAAAVLRQLLLDGSPLLHQVNRTRRLSIRYRTRVQQFNHNPGRAGVTEIVQSFGTSLDPAAPSRFGVVHDLTLDEFLAVPVVAAMGRDVSVREIIRYFAHVGGGVHAFEPESDVERDLLAAFPGPWKSHETFSEASGQLFAIGEIVLRALETLKQRVLDERGQR